MPKAYVPVQVGAMNLTQRIVMAPMTRFRADDAHVPLPIVTKYYAQRASVPGTLIITEATFISAAAGGYDNVPGIFNDEQIKMWRHVTDAVHAKKSFIVLQLWALGRAADRDVLARDGHQVVSSSAVPISEESPTPKPLSEVEIQQYIQTYAQAAKNAIEAGFDAVEIHGANGYLVDQFLQDTCNKRIDQWGGNVENRSRFALAVTKAVADAIGPERTGIRLSPWSRFQAMRMDDPVPQFTHLARELSKLKLAYVHLVESRVSGAGDSAGADQLNFFLSAYQKASPAIVAGGYSAKGIDEALEVTYGEYDVLVAIGRYFTSNPDLIYRVKKGIPLCPYERDHFYTAKSPRGFIDYPFSAEWECSEAEAELAEKDHVQS